MAEEGIHRCTFGYHAFKIKALIVSLVMLLLPTFFLSASDIRWNWKGDPEVKYYRYQIDKEDEDGWILVEKGRTSVVTPDLDIHKEHFFYLQSSVDGVNWSATLVGRRAAVRETAEPQDKEGDRQPEKVEKTEKKEIDMGMRFSLSPYAAVFYDFINGHEIKDAYYLTNSSYAVSADAEYYVRPCSWFSFNLSAGWTGAEKIRYVVPNGKFAQYVRLSAGMDFLLSNGKESAGIGIFGGAMFHMNSKYWNVHSMMGARVLAESRINDSLAFTISGRATVSYLPSDEPLYRSLTVIFEPATFALNWKF